MQNLIFSFAIINDGPHNHKKKRARTVQEVWPESQRGTSLELNLMSDLSSPSASAPRPTHVRYLVVLLATAMSLLLYLHRYFPSFLLPYMRDDFRLTDNQVGWFAGLFFFTYALGQVPSGWLSDRFGARLMLTLYILTWSLFTGLMGVVWTFALLLLMRLGAGLAQAGAYPTGGSMISKWVPFAARATASSLVVLGGRFGAAVAPVLGAVLLLAFVPPSVPARLTAEDLIDPNEFVRQLQTRGKPATNPKERETERLADLIRARLPVRTASTADGSANATQEELLVSLNDLLAEAHSDVPETAASTIGLLASPWGQGPLLAVATLFPGRPPGLYEQIDAGQFQLPVEAQHLAAIPEAELSASERIRRNRFLLEAAFPRHIRKLYGQGWRPVTVVVGVAGLVMALLFWWGVRNRPEDHPGCNLAERQLIDEGRPEVTSPHGRAGALPWRHLLRSRSLTLSSVSQFGTNFGWGFLGQLLPFYLVEVHHTTPLPTAFLAGLPLLAGIAGMFAGGRLTDALTLRLGVKWGRRWPMFLTRFIAMSAYLVCLGTGSLWLLIPAFCLVAVATDLGTSSIWAFCQDVGGKHVGSVLGWGNMWGNFGAFLSPIVLMAISSESGLFAGLLSPAAVWPARFLVCAGAFALSGISAFGVDATIPVVPPEEE
jgi:MFS family permease